MANLIVIAVPPDQTGVATGMNTIMRTIGGALGSQVIASVLTANVVTATGLPAERGFTIAFWLAAAALAVSVVAALAIPGRTAGDEARALAPTGQEA
jgi:hypothetical protein